MALIKKMQTLFGMLAAVVAQGLGKDTYEIEQSGRKRTVANGQL